MRDAYHEDLEALTGRLVEMTRLVRSAMSRSTTALLDADLQLAESVISRTRRSTGSTRRSRPPSTR
jgi:phosphate transport system protein